MGLVFNFQGVTYRAAIAPKSGQGVISAWRPGRGQTPGLYEASGTWKRMRDDDIARLKKMVAKLEPALLEKIKKAVQGWE